MNYKKILSSIMLILSLCGLYSPVFGMGAPIEPPCNDMQELSLDELSQEELSQENLAVYSTIDEVSYEMDGDGELDMFTQRDLVDQAVRNEIEDLVIALPSFRPITRGNSAQLLPNIQARTPLTPYDRSATPMANIQVRTPLTPYDQSATPMQNTQTRTPLTPYEQPATPMLLPESPTMSREDTAIYIPALAKGKIGSLKRSVSSNVYGASLSALKIESSSSSSSSMVPVSAMHIRDTPSRLTPPRLDAFSPSPFGNRAAVQPLFDDSAFSSSDFQDLDAHYLDELSSSSETVEQRTSRLEAAINYSYSSWAQACGKLPSYTRVRSSWENTALNWTEFNEVLQRFLVVNQTWYRDRADLWIHDQPKVDDPFFDTKYTFPPRFKPFLQKLIINPGVQVAIRGDLHGDVHSLIAYLEFLQKEGHLNGFAIKDKSKFHMVFLGDYVDRGNYGVEVLYTLMRLKVANPDNVTLVRGNHEDTHMCNKNGFGAEFVTKFGNDFDKYHSTIKMYDFLPVALYLGSGSGESKDFMQCCHGGMEVGYDPLDLLNSESSIAFSWISCLNRLSEFKKLDLTKNGLATAAHNAQFASIRGLKDMEKIDSCRDIGFMWSDFQVSEETQPLISKSIRDDKGGRIYEYDKALTQAILKHVSLSKHKVRGVLRAHQHSNVMGAMMKSILDPHNETCHKGVSKLWKDPKYKANKHAEPDVWDGMVCTFLVAPDSVYSCKNPNVNASSICDCDVPYSLNGCRGRVPTEKNPCKSALFDFDAFAIMTTADTYDQWKLKVHRNMLQDIIPQFRCPMEFK